MPFSEEFCERADAWYDGKADRVAEREAKREAKRLSQTGYTMTAERVKALHPEFTEAEAAEIADAVNRYDPLTEEEAERTADWKCYMRLPRSGNQRRDRSH